MAVHKQKGSIGFVMLLAFGFLAIIGGIYFFLFKSDTSSNTAASFDPKSYFAELRELSERALADPLAVEMSMQRNSNHFSCLYSSSGNCLGKGGGFLLYPDADPKSQPLSQLVKNHGLDRNGLGCEGFPSETCPFRVSSSWTPVCAPGDCLSTKSFRVKISVVYEDSKEPLKWEKEELLSPPIRLSDAIQCERSGRAWTGNACVENGNFDRVVASEQLPDPDQRPEVDRNGSERAAQEMPAGYQEARQDPYICPEMMTIQGNMYTLEMLGPSKAQVRVPAINGCPAEDIFRFTCVAKNPPDFEGEGQWIQTEAEMAPNCDERGMPIGAPASI